MTVRARASRPPDGRPGLLPAASSAADGRVSAFDHVREQLSRLVGRFDLTESETMILGIYDVVFARSLAFPLGSRRPLWSRLNDDGTPIQIATAAAGGERTLSFLGEAGWAGASREERLRAGRDGLERVAAMLGGGSAQTPGRDRAPGPSRAVREHSELLDELTFMGDLGSSSDPDAALWLGAGFARSRRPQLKVYANGAWGPREEQWARLRRFADSFEARVAWRRAERLVARETRPLGTAVTFAGDGSVGARIYVSAYGRCMHFYQDLALAVAGSRYAEKLRAYTDCLLGDDRAYPTPTVVCSFGLAANGDLDFKVELCTHCLFASDAEASVALHRALAAAGVEQEGYDGLLDVLGDDELSASAVEIHSYAGIGARGAGVQCPVYMKPRLSARRAAPT